LAALVIWTQTKFVDGLLFGSQRLHGRIVRFPAK